MLKNGWYQLLTSFSKCVLRKQDLTDKFISEWIVYLTKLSIYYSIYYRGLKFRVHYMLQEIQKIIKLKGNHCDGSLTQMCTNIKKNSEHHKQAKKIDKKVL